MLDISIDLQMMSIVVENDAWLTIASSPRASYKLRAVCIAVKPRGTIRAGTADEAFEGELDFQLSGDEFTDMPQALLTTYYSLLTTHGTSVNSSPLQTYTLYLLLTTV